MVLLPHGLSAPVSEVAAFLQTARDPGETIAYFVGISCQIGLHIVDNILDSRLVSSKLKDLELHLGIADRLVEAAAQHLPALQAPVTEIGVLVLHAGRGRVTERNSGRTSLGPWISSWVIMRLWTSRMLRQTSWQSLHTDMALSKMRAIDRKGHLTGFRAQSWHESYPAMMSGKLFQPGALQWRNS